MRGPEDRDHGTRGPGDQRTRGPGDQRTRIVGNPQRVSQTKAEPNLGKKNMARLKILPEKHKRTQQGTLLDDVNLMILI